MTCFFTIQAAFTNLKAPYAYAIIIIESEGLGKLSDDVY